jgi:hypothetical protein
MRLILLCFIAISCIKKDIKKTTIDSLYFPTIDKTIEHPVLEKVQFTKGTCVFKQDESKEAICITKEEFEKDFKNINSIRISYNNLANKYISLIEYYENILTFVKPNE